MEKDYHTTANSFVFKGIKRPPKKSYEEYWYLFKESEDYGTWRLDRKSNGGKRNEK